jgi:hypothetical protein
MCLPTPNSKLFLFQTAMAALGPPPVARHRLLAQTPCVFDRRITKLCTWPLVAIAVALTGCTHIALRDNTVQTTNTLADLQYQQVLDNLARFQDDPDAVPSFAVPTAGTVSINDQTGIGVSPTYSPTLSYAAQGGGALPILSLLFPFSGQRALTENWSLTPITDADNLRRLRCAYRLLVMGSATPNREFCVNQMKEFFAGEEADLADNFPPRGWYGVGTKTDVPKKAAYVGLHGSTCVWVMASGRNDLAVFSMAALDLATGKVRTPQRTVVRKYRGEPTTQNLEETTVTTTEDDESALDVIKKGRTRPADRARITDAPHLNAGLLATPRP